MSITVQTLFGTYDEKELKALKGCLEELSDCMTKIDNEKVFMKDIIDTTADKFKIPKKIIRKLSKAYHDRSFDEIASEYNEIEALYNGINEVK